MHTAARQPRRFAMVGAWCAELLPRVPYQASYAHDGPTLGFAFEGQVGVHAFGSDRRTGFRAKPNSLAYVPRDCDVFSESEHGGEYLKISFTREQGGPLRSLRRFNDVIDGAAIAAAQGLRGLLLQSERLDALRCERFVEVLSARAICALGGTIVQSRVGSCMTPWRLRLIDDLIESKLDNTLTVQELAGALGLSAGFFSRAFKAAVGKAPHDHIVDRRVARARTLLRSTDFELSAIAHASGFSSHAHMTSTFRNRLGVNPAELRKSVDRRRHGP